MFTNRLFQFVLLGFAFTFSSAVVADRIREPAVSVNLGLATSAATVNGNKFVAESKHSEVS